MGDVSNARTVASVLAYSAGVRWGCTVSRYLDSVEESVGTGRRGSDSW
jgi:hypothetical protein